VDDVFNAGQPSVLCGVVVVQDEPNYCRAMLAVLPIHSRCGNNNDVQYTQFRTHRGVLTTLKCTLMDSLTQSNRIPDAVQL
jgi:hypothetical protein